MDKCEVRVRDYHSRTLSLPGVPRVGDLLFCDGPDGFGPRKVLFVAWREGMSPIVVCGGLVDWPESPTEERND